MQMMKKMNLRILAVASEIIHMPWDLISDSKHIHFYFNVIRILLSIVTIIYQAN